MAEANGQRQNSESNKVSVENKPAIQLKKPRNFGANFAMGYNFGRKDINNFQELTEKKQKENDMQI